MFTYAGVIDRFLEHSNFTLKLIKIKIEKYRLFIFVEIKRSLNLSKYCKKRF